MSHLSGCFWLSELSDQSHTDQAADSCISRSYIKIRAIDGSSFVQRHSPSKSLPSESAIQQTLCINTLYWHSCLTEPWLWSLMACIATDENSQPSICNKRRSKWHVLVMQEFYTKRSKILSIYFFLFFIINNHLRIEEFFHNRHKLPLHSRCCYQHFYHSSHS